MRGLPIFCQGYRQSHKDFGVVSIHVQFLNVICEQLIHGLRSVGILRYLLRETRWLYTLLQDTLFPYVIFFTKQPITHCHVSNML